MSQPARPGGDASFAEGAQSPSLPHPKTLRVAVFSDSLPERNGAGAYYQDLAIQLQDELGDIQLFQPAKRRRFLRLAFPLPGDSTQKLITPNVIRLWREYKQLKPHVVVAVTPGPFGLVGAAFARRTGATLITGFHTHFEELVRIYGDTLFFRTCHVYLTQVNKVLCKRSGAVLVNNRGLIPTVEALGAKAVEVMATPLARSFLDTPIVEPPAKLERVLLAGRLAAEKNPMAFVDAAREFPQVTFVIAGEGPLRKEVEAAAADLHNIRLTGWLDREALCAEMDQANLLVLPSHFETFGTVALEAMARGRPALVSARAGIHDWPALSQALFMIEPEETVAAALRRLEAMPQDDWMHKALAARQAAHDLNRVCIHQWAGMLSRYAAKKD